MTDYFALFISVIALGLSFISYQECVYERRKREKYEDWYLSLDPILQNTVVRPSANFWDLRHFYRRNKGKEL